MAIGKYEVWLSQYWDGVRLASLNSFLSLEYTRAVHGVGAITLVMPHTFDFGLVGQEYKIEVWREPPGGSLLLENVYLIHGWRQWHDANGSQFIKLMGVDGNDLLKRRIVWEQSGTAWVKKTDHAGDMAKAVVREMMLESTCSGAASVAREGLGSWLTVQADNSDGASFTKRFPGKNVFDVVMDIVQTSTAKGTTLYWHVVPLSATQYEFRTYLGQVGQVRSIILGINYNNMIEPAYEWDASQEYNAALGFGEKMGNSSYPYRRYADAAGNARDSYYFGRREVFVDCPGEIESDPIFEKCAQTLVDNPPKETFYCTMVENADQRYRLHWDLGDKLQAEYLGRVYDCMVKSVYVNVTDSEKIKVVLDIPQVNAIS